MNLIPSDTDYTFSHNKDEHDKRPKTHVEVNKQPLLYDSNILDKETNRYNYFTPCKDDTDVVLRDQAPGLLALKNKTSKSNIKKPVITVPGNSVSSEQIRSYSTLMTSKHLQPLNLGQNKLAVKIQKEKELEASGLDFDDDPVAYFFKHKDGRGHLFIYLIFEKPRSDPEFSPYQLKKVTHTELTPEFFTMSSNGVTHMYVDGSSETVELDKWARFKTLFSAIKKLSFFKKYHFWKHFRLWKKFVKMQRYALLRSKILDNSWYSNNNFFKYLLEIMKETCDSLIQKDLLSIISQRKYKLEEYKRVTSEHIEHLKSEYNKFLSENIEKMMELDAEIRDPQRTLVKETDFQKNKAIIPNLGQLMVLNEKMNEEKSKRMKIVHNEIIEFGNFIRLVDYIELEVLSAACLKCWKNAESNITQEMSAIFQVEVMFNDEGKIVFEPTLETLKKTVSDSLDNSIHVIETLPRILNIREFTPYLRETVGNITSMVSNRLRFMQCVKSNNNYKIIKKNILDTIEKSYIEAEKQSQKFTEFYELYKIGRTWNASDYMLERGGPENPFNLTKYTTDFDREPDSIIYDPSKEIIVDFDKIREDVLNLKKEEQRINQFRSATVRGALFIDSKNLRAELTPIPVKSMQDIQTILHNVLSNKIDHIATIFRFSSKRLKKEPNTLKEYTENSEFLTNAIELNKSILQEIIFVDDLMTLIDRIGFSNRPGEHLRNPLSQLYRIFQQDLQTGINIRDANRDRFVGELTIEVNNMGRALASFERQINKVPQDIVNSDINTFITTTNELKTEIEKLEPEVQSLQRCQKIMNIEIKDLSSFSNLKTSIEFIMQVYDLTKDWQVLANIISTVPFCDIDISKFGTDLNSLNTRASKLIETKAFDSSLLNIIQQKINTVLPYMEQLELLSTSKMHFHHWSKLFEECGQGKSYYAQIKIEEMIANGILNEKEKIENISSIAMGESQLETEYNDLANEWKNVNLPLMDSQIKSEDSLLLGDLSELYAKITDSQLRLQRMLTLPFVQGLREQIMALSTQLDYYNKVLDAWTKFQASWVILASFFTPEETKKAMQTEANKFMIVRRRWVNLVRHTLENTALYHVCSFASLLEMLIDNNNCLEQICSNVLKKIDCKRVQFPRLFFLSNTDVLSIFSTTDFNTMNRLMSKMFMHIKCFERHPLDETELALQQNLIAQNFQRIKVYGMTGDSSDTLVFTRNIVLSGSIDAWGQTMLDVMKQSIMTHVSESIYKFTNSSLEDWILSVPVYIAILTTQIMFSRDVEECFNNFENNVHSFIQYKAKIEGKIKQLGSFLKVNKGNQLNKISSIITLLCYQLDKIERMSIRNPNYSQRYYWETLPHLKFNQKTSQIFIENIFSSWEHGYEFWGEIRQMIMSPESDTAMMNVFSAMPCQNFPLLFGSDSIGRKLLLSNIAALFGKFVFFSPSFADEESVIFKRLLTGTVGSGSWLVFNNVDKADKSNLANMTKFINIISSAKKNNASQITIEENTVNFSKQFNMFFIGGEKSGHSGEIPDCLKASLHFVAFQKPDFEKIAKINFMANGFKTYELSKPLVHFIRLLRILFPYLSSKPLITDIISVTYNGLLFIKKIVESKKNQELNLKDDKEIETLAIATSLVRKYQKRIKKHHSDIFFKTLYSHFTIFDTIEKFKEAVLVVYHKQEVEFISEIMRIAGEELFYPEVFKKRILYYIKEFLTALPYNRCMILVGKAKTGKSFIVELITKAIQKILGDPELSKKYSYLLPFKVMDIFFRSDQPEKFYGYSNNDETGPNTVFGLLHSCVNKLEKFNGYERFLRLNGPLDDEAIRFIREMLTSGDSPRIILNTMQTFTEKSNFHIIIETDDISKLDPSILGSSKIMIFESISTNIPVSMKGAPSFNADYIFSSVFNTKPIDIPSNTLKTIREQFTEVVPLVIKYVVNTPNNIWSYSSSIFVTGGDLLIAEQLPFYSLYYAFLYLKDSKADETNSTHTKYILIHSIFLVFSTIIDQNSISSFDNWIRNHFLIKMPSDWVGFDVPQHFWDVFPRPTLLSVRFSEGRMIPLDYSLLKKPPIVEQHISNQTINLTDDVSVCTAQFLPAIHQAKILIKMKQNFILSGCNQAGKTNCVKYMFSDHDCGAFPIFIPVAASTTATDIISFIKNHTQVMAKVGSKGIEDTCALVFEDVPPENLMAIEFIRQLVTHSHIYQFSQLDPQYLDIVSLNNFIVIVTTNCLSKLSTRFSSLFMVIGLNPFNSHSMKYIFSTVAQHFNISREFYEPAFTFTEKCAQKPLVGFNFIHLLDIFCLIQNRTSPTRNDYLDLIRALISELKTLHVHKLTTTSELQNFSSIFHAIFQDADAQLLYDSVMHGSNIYYPEIEVSEETKSLVANFSFHQKHLVREELVFLLSQFNSKTVPKPRINFYKPIIQQWVYLQRLLMYPGRNIMVVGPQGSGRFTLSAFTAITKGFEFIYITPNDKKESNAKRSAYLTEVLNSLVNKVAETNKKYAVLFRANSETDFDFQFIMPLFQNYNFLPFITEEERKEIYAKIVSHYPQLIDKPYSVYEYLRYQMKTRIKFIIVSNKNFITHYKNFQVLKMEIETIELIEDCASDAFQNATFRKGLVDFSPNVPKAIATMYMNISSRFPLFEINHYYDFINTFMFFFKNKVFEIEEHKENLKNAIDFFEITGKLHKETKAELNKLHPVLDNCSEADANMFKAFAAKKDTIKARLKKINDAEEHQMKQVKELEEETERLKKEIVNLNVKVELDRGKVEGISQQTLNGFRLLDGSRNTCVKLLLEMLLAFMGMKTSYEPYGRRLINDGKFIYNILNRIKGTEFNPKYLSNVSDYLEKLRPLRKEMDTYNPAIGIIFDWISDTYDACAIDSKVADRTNQLNGYRIQLKKFLNDSEIEKESIKQVEASIQEEIDAFQKSIDKRDSEKSEYYKIKEKFDMIETIMNGADHLVETWMIECSNTKTKMDIAITDTILFSAFVVFFGVMTKTQQEEVLKEAFDVFETLELQYNKKTTIKDLYCTLKLVDDEEQINFDSNSLFETEISWRRIRMIFRPPLIIDSEGAMRRFILDMYKPKKTVQISTKSSNLRSTIINCMETGKKLLIFDVDDLCSDLFYLLQLPTDRDEEEINFPIFDKIVKVSPKFKLFLFTSLRKLEEIPLSITSRVSVINMSTTSHNSIALIIARKFIEAFDQDNLARFINAERLGMQRATEIHRYELEALEVISDVRTAIKDNDGYDLLHDPDTVDSIVRSKECYLFALAGKTDTTSISNEMQHIIEPYLDICRLCSSMWITLSRYLPRIQRSDLFLFDKFLKVIDNAIQEKKDSESEDIKDIIVKHVIKYVFSQVPLVDGYVFLFISVVMATHTEKQFSGFEDIIMHISDELYDVCDIRNSDITRGDPLEKLKFANISSVFPIIRNYLIEQIGDKFEDYIPNSDYSNFDSNSQKVPVIVKTNNYKCLTAITMKMKAQNTVTISLSCSPGYINSIKEIAKQAIEEGSTLVLFYSGTEREATIVEDIYEMIDNPNNNFRLVVLCSSFKAMPQTILVNSLRINYESFPSIRHIMFKIFNFNSALVSGSAVPSLMKKLSFSIAISTAMIKIRQFFTPLGTYDASYIQEYVQPILRKTSTFIDKITTNDFPIKNVQELYNIYVVGAMCLDKFDRTKLEEETKNILAPQWLENTIRFRGYEWIIDREWDIPKIIEVIKGLPIFPTCKILGMDPITSTPVFNWKLGRWIATPLSHMSKKIKILPADVRLKIESFATMIPPPIKIPQDYEVQTPLTMFIINEVNWFNKATQEISLRIAKALSDRDDRIFDYVSKSLIPPEWKKIIGYFGTDNITKFFSMLFDKSQFLLNWIKAPTIPSEIDIRLIRDIPGFFDAYHTDIAIKKGVPRESIKLQFSFQPEKDNGVSLINVVLMGANWDKIAGSIVKSNKKTPSFTKIPVMSLIEVPNLTHSDSSCIVPLLKNIPSLGYTDDSKLYENFITNIDVTSALTQEELILNGVAFICQIHDTFC